MSLLLVIISNIRVCVAVDKDKVGTEKVHGEV